jgi:hypothetical protein
MTFWAFHMPILHIKLGTPQVRACKKFSVLTRSSIIPSVVTLE